MIQKMAPLTTRENIGTVSELGKCAPRGPPPGWRLDRPLTSSPSPSNYSALGPYTAFPAIASVMRRTIGSDPHRQELIMPSRLRSPCSILIEYSLISLSSTRRENIRRRSHQLGKNELDLRESCEQTIGAVFPNNIDATSRTNNGSQRRLFWRSHLGWSIAMISHWKYRVSLPPASQTG